MTAISGRDRDDRRVDAGPRLRLAVSGRPVRSPGRGVATQLAGRRATTPGCGAGRLRDRLRSRGWDARRRTGSSKVRHPSASAAGDPLEPRERRAYAVRVATAEGWTDWSDPLVIEAGISGAGFEAKVIGIPTEIDGPVPLLRQEFTLGSAPARGRLRLSALGLVDAWINGAHATDALLTPGWTSYDARVLIDTVDVTSLLREGTNVIVLAVADGWYRGRMGFAARTEIYGDRVRSDRAGRDRRRRGRWSTDPSWRAGFGPIRSASIYDGTEIDQRLDDPAVHEPGFAREEWVPASVVDTDLSVFEPRTAPPVRVVTELPMTPRTHGGRVQLDAGQNVVGLGAARGPRKRGGRRDDPPRGSARAVRRRCTPPPFAPRRRPTSTRWPPTASTCSSPLSPSTASGTRMSSAQPWSRPPPSRSRAISPPAARSTHRTPPSISSTQRVLVAARQLRIGADRLPAARRASRLDGRRAGLRRHRQHPDGRRGVLGVVAARPRARPD